MKYLKPLTKPYRTDPPFPKWLTRALFWDWARGTTRGSQLEFEPVFTLYDDRPGAISGRKTFVELGDPTGYLWAMKYLGDYNNWLALLECKWFQEALTVWQFELKQKLRADALSKLKDIEQNGLPAQAISAAKFLASFEWEKNEKRGRPGKSEMDAEVKRLAQVVTQEESDAERIGLTIINGGKK